MIPLGEFEDDTLEGIVELDFATGKTMALSWQILDPLLSGDKDQWKLEPDTGENAGTPGQPNKVPQGTGNSGAVDYISEPSETSSEKSVFRFVQRSPRGHKVDGIELDRGDEYSTGSRVASKGYFTHIHTGMQKDGVWERMGDEEAQKHRVFRTLNLGGREEIEGMPPDYLLLNLMGANYPMAHSQWRAEGSLPDQFTTNSHMASTAGQVNLNSKIYPENQWFNPPERRKPLEGVLVNLKTTESRAELKRLLDGIGDFQSSKRVFEYIGQLSEVPGYRKKGARTEFERDEILRNMASGFTQHEAALIQPGYQPWTRAGRGIADLDELVDGEYIQADLRFSDFKASIAPDPSSSGTLSSRDVTDLFMSAGPNPIGNAWPHRSITESSRYVVMGAILISVPLGDHWIHATGSGEEGHSLVYEFEVAPVSRDSEWVIDQFAIASTHEERNDLPEGSENGRIRIESEVYATDGSLLGKTLIDTDVPGTTREYGRSLDIVDSHDAIEIPPVKALRVVTKVRIWGEATFRSVAFELDASPKPVSLAAEVEFSSNKSGTIAVQSEKGFTYSLKRSMSPGGDSEELERKAGTGSQLVFAFDDSSASDPEAYFWIVGKPD